MSRPESVLNVVPNEILSAILSLLSTKELLALAPTCTRLHSLAARILYRRLVRVAPLPAYDLVLECYQPSAKLSTPSLACRHLGTQTWGGIDVDEEAPRLADLREIYSCFRPTVAATRVSRPRRLRPWGAAVSPSPPASTDSVSTDVGTTTTTATTTTTSDAAAGSGPASGSGPNDHDTATEDVYLDDGQLFLQLCATTSVVQQGPRRGLFMTHVNISDCVVRVWREWLANLALSDNARRQSDSASSRDRPALRDDKDVLWVDTAKTVGLRFRVMPGPAERMPVITGPDDEPPMAYTLVYQEILVQTSKLLLAVERSTSEEVAHSGKAIVIAGI